MAALGFSPMKIEINERSVNTDLSMKKARNLLRTAGMNLAPNIN